MKVLLGTTFGGGDQFITELRNSFPDVTFELAETEEQQQLHIRDAEAFYGWPSRESVLAARQLRWIHSLGTGIERIISIPEVVESDVIVTNARGSHADPMADHVFGMMLTFAHRLRELGEDQRAHRWEARKYTGKMLELGGRTIGILGLGDIGSAVAQRANSFGMNVYAVALRPRPAPSGVKELWTTERLDDLIRISDWFVVTVPLTPQTRGLIDRRRIGLLKPDAHIIVISRGGIVDLPALTEALQAGRIAGAGLDAIGEEAFIPGWRLPPDSPLWDLENVILTPHVSAFTPEMYARHREEFKENLRLFLASEPFPHVCDKRAGF